MDSAPASRRVSSQDLETALRALETASGDPQAGIFGQGSPGWIWNREAAVMLGGGAAVLMQLAHPYVAAAIRDHSETRKDVSRRFARTFTQIFAMVYGTRDDALRAARRVHRIHERIVGEVGETVGACVPSTRYHANDLDGLVWVHATLVHTAVRAVEFASGTRPARSRDAYVRESHKLAALFGIPASALPDTFADLDSYVAERIACGAIEPGEAAKTMAAFLLPAASGWSKGPVVPVLRLLTAGLLPASLREAYGLPWDRPRQVAFAAFGRGLRAGYPRLPDDIRFLPAYTAATRRLQQLPPSAIATTMERLMERMVARL